MRYIWKVSLKEEGMRLDHFLQKKVQEEGQESFPARFFKKQIEKNQCIINHKVERFASYKVQAKDQVEFQFSQIQKASWKVLFEDSEIIAIDKPPGLVSDPASFSYSPYFLVHRLDKDTSGVLLLAKTESAKSHLMNQFRKKVVEKCYVAIAQGKVTPKRGKIAGLYAKKKRFLGNALWGTSEEGSLAETFFRVIAANSVASLVEVVPKTGKTHQIRAHFSEMGHPLVGDYQYGTRDKLQARFSRHLLHAWKIRFLHPLTEEVLFITAPIPDDFFQEAKKYHLLKSPLPGETSPSTFWRKLQEKPQAKDPSRQKRRKKRF